MTADGADGSQAEEEVRALQKKIQQVENELDQVQENLGNANSKLDEKDKALQVVRRGPPFPFLLPLHDLRRRTAATDEE